MYTTKEILSKSSRFCAFLADLSSHGICNRNGSAFRTHPKCYWSNGILLTNEWSTHDYCSIKIASDKSAKCIAGCQNAAVDGDAHPYLNKGKFVSVWCCGKWEKDGPWVKQIDNLIDDLIVRLEKVKKDRAAEAEAKKKENARKAEIRENDLVTEWEN